MASNPEGEDFATPSMDELLRISIKLSDQERLQEAAAQGASLSMSKEDQEWLKEAMGMTQKSDADRMKEALAVINDAAESQPHKEYALDLILFCIEDIDNACDFVKFDGAVATLLQLLEADVPTFRLGAAWLLGTLVQNNPKAQDAVLGASADVVRRLDAMARGDGEVEVRRKALLAISGLVRNSEAGQAAFLAAEGPSLLASLLSGGDAALQKRAMFLAAHLLGESPALFTPSLGDTALGLVGLCSGLVGASGGDWDGEDLDLREQGLKLLVKLLGAARGAAGEEESQALRRALEARAAEISGLKDEPREWREAELELGRELLGLLG